MSNVIVDKNKIDILANAISCKSGEPVTMTLDEMVEAVDSIEAGGGGITPTGNINITQAGITDVTNYATATVEDGGIESIDVTLQYYSLGDKRKARIIGQATVSEGWSNVDSALIMEDYDAIPTGTTVTPTTSAQTIGGANTMMEGAVTVNAVSTAGYVNMISPGVSIDVQVNSSGYVSVGTEVNELANPISQDGYATTSDEVWLYYQGGGGYQLSTQAAATITPTESSQTAVTAGKYTTGAVTVGAISSSYVGSGITRRSSSDLTASGATVTVPSGYYSAQASKAVASGTAGTPTATKGTVSNHSISVTPSVTNTSGYITGSTKTGTSVTVSASELVSGTYTVSASGTHDVTNYASASVASGSATASATKGTVSNHSVTVTPSVTRTAGYITAGSANGTAVTVSASELVGGTLSLSANGTSDCTNYASVNVNIPFVTYYTGSSTPSSSLGSNGDIYLKTV